MNLLVPDADTPRSRTVRALRSWIEEGRFNRGEAMPAERVLAKQLGVARVTVRSALAQLAQEGLLDTAFRRKRRVAGLAGRGLMAQTVAVLSNSSTDSRKWIKRGWDDFIQYEAARLIEEAGLHVLTLNPQKLLDGGLPHLLAQRPCGVMTAHAVSESEAGRAIIAACVGAGVPVAAYGYSPLLRNCDVVTGDQEAGSYALTRWLIAHGRRRILRLWRFQGNWEWLEQRNAGYERAMREAGLEPLPVVRTKDLSGNPNDRVVFEDMTRGIAAYLVEHVCGPEPIDAVMSGTDAHAIQVAAALRLFGKRPNDDVLVVGYDNNWRELESRHWEVEGPLATVDKCDLRIASEMACLLLDRIAGRLPPTPQRRVVPGELRENDRALFGKV